jgi:hypothetical protein
MACADEDVVDEHCFHVGLGEHPPVAFGEDRLERFEER